MNNKNITDMTTGGILSHILQFAFPLLIGNLFQQLYNMVDSLIVGNYVGSDALAAVGTCASVNFLFFSLCSGLSTGIGIIVSQYFGAKQDTQVRYTIANSAYVLVSASLCVATLGFLVAPTVLRILNTPESIIGNSIIYMRTTCCGILFIALYNGISSILRALGDSKTPLYFLILSSITNVILDLIFVLTLGWSVFGVALATIISQFISAITSIIYAYHKISYFRLDKSELKPDFLIIKKAFRLGLPVALQQSMIAFSMMVLQGIVNSFGPAVIAAYTIVSRVEQIVQQPYMSLSMALINFSGQNVGAGLIDRVKKAFRKCIFVVLIFSVCLIPIAYLFGEPIINLFIKEQEVVTLGAKALRITSLCYFGLGMIYVPRAILNGSGDTAFSMINGITEVTCRVLYSNILTRIPVIGYWGIWITTGFTWVTTAIICICRYATGIWKTKAIVSKKETTASN